jgi:LmbE family N-acetylglucosaminyl deacetylase
MLGLHPGDRALVVATHIDDESLGLGGTIAKMAAYGVEVDVLVIACTTAPMYGGGSDAEIRRAELNNACAALGVQQHHVAWIDDDRAADPAAHLPELIRLIESGPGPSLQTRRPQTLFIPAGDAHHQDHRAVHKAGIAASRPGDPAHRWIPETVLGYDGPEDRCWRAVGTDRPILVDTTDYWPVKEKALLCHASQLRQPPHPRSITKIRALDEAAGGSAAAATAERFVAYRMGF